MKKFINSPQDVERQVVDGYVKSYPTIIAKAADDIVVRAQRKVGKVVLVSGGGMGHEPAHLGYVGYGMLDAAVGGAIYTSPAVDRVEAAIEAVAPGSTGVLLVVKNYTGDVVNFKMAAEAARDAGADVDYVVVDDDVAVKDSSFTVGRRGVAGTCFVHKCAGAAAEAGESLAEVKRVAEKVIASVRTMGVAIEPCTVPAAGKPGFTLADDEMEMGVGIHGEPGVRRAAMEPADAMVDEILATILEDLDYAGSRVALMVNGAGGTPPYELAIVANRAHDVLAERGIAVARAYMGPFMTSLEMRGFSISLLRLDEELEGLLGAPAHAVAWTEGDAPAAAEPQVAAPTVNEGATTAESLAPTDASPSADPSAALVTRALYAIADAMDVHKDELTELDMPIGDSDHGINMARGFDAVREQLPALAGADASTLVNKAAMTIISKVGGSSGPLYGTLMRRMAREFKGCQEVSLAGFARGLKSGIAGIEELAGGAPGDKTMLDAMVPALRSLEDSLDRGISGAEALEAAARAAADGAEATIPLVARKGRASYLGERSVGHKDPGATSFAYIMAAIARCESEFRACAAE